MALEAQNLTGVNGVVSYVGIYKPGQATEDAGKAFTNLVLGNRVMFGSVNANKTYFSRGAADLVKTEKRWPGLLEAMITRRMKPSDLAQAYAQNDEDDIKTIIEFNR